MFEKPNFQFCNRALYAQYVCGYFRTIDSLDFMFVFALKEIKNLMLIFCQESVKLTSKKTKKYQI